MSSELQVILTVSLAVLAYLIGSFSTGTVVSESNRIDIRTKGSKNPGATNVLRVMGTKWGLITFAGDILKTSIACGLSFLILPGTVFGIERFGLFLAALCAVLGHNWPVYYRFCGGKGVACTICAVAFIDLPLGLIAAGIAILLIVIFRYISLASISFTLIFFVLCLVYRSANIAQCVVAGILFVLCTVRHQENIKRLLKGTENKFGKHVK